MKILRASLADINTVLSLTKNCTQHLIEKGIFQWNKHYPSKAVLQKDIELQQLWKLEKNNLIIGVVAITTIKDPEYFAVKWLCQSNKNLYIHRLAVHPHFQGKGYAKKLMDFAENYGRSHHFQSIRLDTFSQNKRNQQFYKNRNYTKLESIYFPQQSSHPFYCYELLLNV